MRNQEYFDKASDNAKLIYLGLLEVADAISVATQNITETMRDIAYDTHNINIITEESEHETD